MDAAVLVALTGVGVALVNMIGSVLIMWIRARYRWENGHRAEESGPPTPPER